jgi:hypothetical protein
MVELGTGAHSCRFDGDDKRIGVGRGATFLPFPGPT